MSRLRDKIAKAIADHIGHGMAEKCEGHADAAIAALQADDAGAELRIENYAGRFSAARQVLRDFGNAGLADFLNELADAALRATPPAKAEAAGLILVGWQYTGSDDGALVRDIATPPEWKTDGEHRPVYVLARDAMEGEVAALPPVDWMVLVPREPTPGMIEAAMNVGTPYGTQGRHDIYHAMLAAAPATPAGKGDEAMVERLAIVVYAARFGFSQAVAEARWPEVEQKGRFTEPVRAALHPEPVQGEKAP